MTSRSREHRHAGAVWFVIVALVLALSSTLLPAQDGQEELTFEELQEQREAAAQRIANAAATIDVTTATIDELATAIDEIDALASIHQLRLQEAIDRYDSALDRLSHAEELQQEVLAEIDVLRVLVADLALAQFTGETGREPFEIVLSTDPGESARLTHLLDLQIGSAEDALDRLNLLEFQADELVAERNAASSVAQESLAEMQHRSAELDAAISQQQQLLESAELRLLASETDAEAAAILFEETEERLINYVRGVGAPAPVDRADIVTISFFEGEGANPFFQIQVHKDIEAETRGLYELAFSQGIDLGGWGFRNTSRQIELRRAHCGSSDFDIWLKPAGQCSPPTARPGFSKHEQGRAIDFQWNGGSIGPRSGAPFRWLAANAPQFGFVNLPSEPWHWSDGTAPTFDPTVALPSFPDDVVPEVEPEGDTVDLLNEPLEEEEDVVAGEEVSVDVDAEPDGAESGEPPPEGIAATGDDAPDEQPVVEPPVGDEPVDEQPDAAEDSLDEPGAEQDISAAPASSPDPSADG